MARAQQALAAIPNGLAGEWGHNPLPWADAEDANAVPCYCGQRGCIETWLSGPGMARDHAAGLLALAAALAITTAALAVLDVVAPGAPQAVEVVILVAANGAATLVRFLVLRAALERRRPRAARAARPGPVRPHPSVERTAR